MTREQLRELGLTDEQVNTIIGIHGSDIESLKSKNASLAVDVTNANEALAKTKKEYEDFKQAKMTDEEIFKEKQAKEEEERIAQFNKAKEAEARYNKLCLEAKAKGLLISGGISEGDVDRFISSIVADTEEATEARAKTLIDYINTQKEAIKKDVMADLVQGTPNPQQDQDSKKTNFEVKSIW